MKNTPQDQSRAKLPTIQQIRREHDLTSRVVAATANVEFSTEYLLEIGAFVDQGDALKILHALSMLTGEHYTLENVGGLCVATPKMQEEQNPRYS
jgi:DNA-binding transcriptional regulator YiaG